MNVIFTSEVLVYLENLIITLYEKEYFSYLESSKRYIAELIDDIQINLPTKLHKPAPKYFDKYRKNMKYAGFRKNRTTTWYVFFKTYQENGEKTFLVCYISNNHTMAQHLN